MKKIYLLSILFLTTLVGYSQFTFDPTIEVDFTTDTIMFPPSPLKTQILFVGGVDMVQTTATYGNPAGEVPAKDWHDFIGFVPDHESDDLGWIIVNHEQVITNDHIGDGGGMTTFKVRRDPVTDTLIIVDQTLDDGRSGKFCNVDFANTVGETGMNCGGIVSPTGRIWTAEEWMRYSNADVFNSQFGDIAGGLRDTLDWTISSDIEVADGHQVEKFENFNWMVEVDPKQAVAIRKQYNWGRNAYEGGAILSDDRTVYVAADETPGYLTKFIADEPGDFTKGHTYVYKQSADRLLLSHFSTFADAKSEISDYDALTKRVYSTNTEGGIQVYSMMDPRVLEPIQFIDLTSYGDVPTSVSCHQGWVAVAIPSDVKTDNGQVILLDSTYSLLATFPVGALPDMLTFSPDGRFIVVANEGEPNDEYTIDPHGTVTIIDLEGGIDHAIVTQVTFDGIDTADIPGVRIFGNGNTSDVAADLEPEYVAITPDSRQAVVSLQENNAFAFIDLEAATIEKITALGFKDHRVVPLDPSDDDGTFNWLRTYDHLYGMYLPDAIAIAEIGGQYFIVSTNEGDARDWDGYSEEERVKDLVLDPTAFPDAATLQADENLGRLNVTTSLGDTDGDGDFDELYCFGGRSFSIWDWDGNQIYDSGTEFAETIEALAPDNFDIGREDNKGSEPESVDIGVFGGRTYAFIGLERYTGIMVYDITDPANAFFVDYYNKNGNDRSPEGVVVIPADESADRTPYLLSTNEAIDDEYLGSLSAYRINGFETEKWVEINNKEFDKMLNFIQEATEVGATMYNRLEWVYADEETNAVYISETGRDNPAGRWNDEAAHGAQYAYHHVERALAQGVTADSSAYWDYYGRVLKLDLGTDSISSYLEGGPYFPEPNVSINDYPEKHLSNPDGIGGLKVNGKNFLIVQEDLNGATFGRLPVDVATAAVCELYLLDLDIENPTIDDLLRVAVTPAGAEVTGGTSTSDGKTLLLNSQHPPESSPYPFNHSLTMAITGWDQITVGLRPTFNPEDDFALFPNPVSRELQFDKIQDVAIYDQKGRRLKVYRDTKSVDLSTFSEGIYFVQNAKGVVKKVIVHR